jgi:hypothetical protein
MRCRSRRILICERLLPSSRLSWRSAGSRALPSIVNPAGRSAARWRLTAARPLKRATWSGAARSFRDSDESAAGAMGRDLLLPPHFRNRKEDPFDAAVVCHQTHYNEPWFALRSCSERLCRFQSWCANTSRRALSPVVPLQVRDLIAVRLAHAIPSWAGTLLRQERRTRVQIVISSVHAKLPHCSASRLRPALFSRQ